MSNKLIKKPEPKVKKQSKLVKHLLKENGWRKTPNWFFYLVLAVAAYGLITNINW